MRKQANVSLMAFAKGVESKEIEVKRYIGVGAVSILAVNPTRGEQNLIYGSSSSTDEIVYTGKATAKDANGNDVEVDQVRITFICKTDPAIACNNNIETIIPVSFFVKKAYNYSIKDGVTKVQVIDKYGRTTWVTSEELKAHAIPEYVLKNGPKAGEKRAVNISETYRPAYSGEEDLVHFLAAYLSFPSPNLWNEEEQYYYTQPDPKKLAESECMLDKVANYFKGDVSEVKEIVAYKKTNRLKIAFGVRTAANGTQYQCAYTSYPMKLSVTSFKNLEKKLADDKKNGRHPKEEYSAANLTEYKVTASDYSKSTGEGVDPFASASPLEDLPDFGNSGTDLPIDTDPFSM